MICILVPLYIGKLQFQNEFSFLPSNTLNTPAVTYHSQFEGIQIGDGLF